MKFFIKYKIQRYFYYKYKRTCTKIYVTTKKVKLCMFKTIKQFTTWTNMKMTTKNNKKLKFTSLLHNTKNKKLKNKLLLINL